MKTKLSEIFTDPYTPLQIRLFIFHRCIKNVFYHKNQTFVEALTAILSQIHQLQVANAWQQELKFSIICLRELTLYLEGPDLTKKAAIHGAAQPRPGQREATGRPPPPALEQLHLPPVQLPLLRADFLGQTPPSTPLRPRITCLAQREGRRREQTE